MILLKSKSWRTERAHHPSVSLITVFGIRGNYLSRIPRSFALKPPSCPDDASNRFWKSELALIEPADGPRFRCHDIRHTLASLLLSQGESLHYVKEQMGHASIQTTVDVYGHLVPGSNRNAVNRLDDVDDMPLKVVSAGAVWMKRKGDILLFLLQSRASFPANR